jgi:HD-like signal output (HDOD) protein
LHTECGSSLLKHWNFPELYCHVAQEHHREKYDHNNDLLVITRMANQACAKMGIDLNKDPSIILALTIEANLLGLSEVAIGELQVKMEDSLNLANYGSIESHNHAAKVL